MFVIAAAVELLRVLQQGKAQFDQSRAFGEVSVRLGKAFGQVLALMFNVAELRLDLGLGARYAAIGCGDKVD